MSDQPSSNLITLTYIIYGLHLFSAINGLLTPALVLTAFLTGWPSILAVILNYVKQGDTQGSYLESHFRWQIRTFWFALLWLVVAFVLIISVIGFLLGWAMLIITGIWILYRIIRGLLCLMDEKPMPLTSGTAKA